MKRPLPISEQHLRKFVSDNSGPLGEDPWDCDIIPAHADLIELHNAYRRSVGHELEAKFTGVKPQPMQLASLLWRDFEYLSRGNPSLHDYADWYIMADVGGPYPQVELLQLDGGQAPIFIICFGSHLLKFIHSAFSKIAVLMHDNISADCLPEHEELIGSEQYSDTNLLAALFNDLEILYDPHGLFSSISPPHISEPYNYCEWVEGARRFILAHELGHSYYSGSDLGVTDIVGIGVDKTLANQWAEELFADYFAMKTILNVYDTPDLSETQKAELQNSLIGIILFFTVWEIARVSLLHRRILSDAHPPAQLRLQAIRGGIKRHPVFSRNGWLQDALCAYWRRINAFRDFTGGSNAGMIHGATWSRTGFYERLTICGREAYEALFELTLADLQTLYQNDPDRWCADRAFF